MADFKILVVDDDPVVRNRFNAFLVDQGCHVITAPDGETGLEAAANAMPDLIFLDVMMPNMDGFQALAELRRMRRTRKIPIIMVTGRTDAVTLIKALRMGASDFISKPFIKDDVARKLSMFLPEFTDQHSTTSLKLDREASTFLHGKSHERMRESFILNFENVYLHMVKLISDRNQDELRRAITRLLDSIQFYQFKGVKEKTLQMLMAITAGNWDDAIDLIEEIYEMFQNLRRSIQTSAN